MINPIYNLPEIQFVGGESQTLIFTFETVTGKDFDASRCRVNLALIPFVNKRGNPVFNKDAELKRGTKGVYNIAQFDLASEDTVKLVGAYVYQITIVDEDNISEIPSQGIMHISKNIHASYITG